MNDAAIAARPETGAPFRAVPLLWPAIGIALLLSAAWAIKDWANLVQLRLPDNDDMARLAQVRDWLGGQGFNDLMQYRLGPPGGASMHWSRLADLGPAALILLLTPLLGRQGAEVAMVIAWPGMLFSVYLLLVASIAVRFGGPRAGLPALVLAALAFPTISLFLPGRIDHHGLQIALTLVLVRAILPGTRLAGGLTAGIAVALSLAIGLEAAPEIVAAMVALGIAWLGGGRDENARALGFAGALGGVTLALLLVARPEVWPEQWCDGFTPASTRATLILAGAWALLGLSGKVATGWKPRLAAAAVLGLGAALLAWRSAPVCLAGPYGALDPFLQHVWMRNVSEARGLFSGQDTIGTSIAFGGLMLAGTALALRRIGEAAWRPLAIFLALSTLAAVPAIRVTYILAGIAVIPFAALLADTRALAPRLALWLFGAGISWNFVATNLDAVTAKPIVAAKAVQQACTAAGPLRTIAALPKGRIIAPVDLGAYLTGMTPHHVVASVYHRNNSGNLAMYRFFLSREAESETLARRWGIDYVALCPDNLHEDGLQHLRPGSLAERLQSHAPPPGWLQPVPSGGSVRVYRVR